MTVCDTNDDRKQVLKLQWEASMRNRVMCKYCGKRFCPFKIDDHEMVCKKVGEIVGPRSMIIYCEPTNQIDRKENLYLELEKLQQRREIFDKFTLKSSAGMHLIEKKNRKPLLHGGSNQYLAVFHRKKKKKKKINKQAGKREEDPEVWKKVLEWQEKSMANESKKEFSWKNLCEHGNSFDQFSDAKTEVPKMPTAPTQQHSVISTIQTTSPHNSQATRTSLPDKHLPIESRPLSQPTSSNTTFNKVPSPPKEVLECAGDTNEQTNVKVEDNDETYKKLYPPTRSQKDAATDPKVSGKMTWADFNWKFIRDTKI